MKRSCNTTRVSHLTLEVNLTFQHPQEDSLLADNSYAWPTAIHENSIRDETINDISNEDDVESEYEIIENGSKRGNGKLVDKRSFQYTMKVFHFSYMTHVSDKKV